MNSSLDTVRGIYGAFAAGDIPGVLGALSEDTTALLASIEQELATP